MSAGRVIQTATPLDLYAHPATPWVATFLGEACWLAGDAEGGELSTGLGPLAVGAGVRGAEGLVEQHEGRPGCEGPREGDALLLAARELVRHAASEAGEAHEVEELLDPGRAGGAWRAADATAALARGRNSVT